MTTTTSTTAVVIDNRSAAERFKQNALAVLQSGSTWVLGAGGALVSILLDRWAVMTTDQQTGILGSFGITNPGTLTILLTIVTLAVRLKPAPRGTVSPALQEALERIAAQQFNARLVAQGQQPLALPAPKLLAITQEQLAAAQVQARVGPVHADDDDAYPETLAPAPPEPPLAVAAPAPPPPMPAAATVLAQFGGEPAAPPELAAAARTVARLYRDAYPTLSAEERSVRIERDVRASAP